MISAPRFLACGDTALTIEFGQEIDPAISAVVLALDAAIAADPPEGLIETLPTYRSVFVQFDPLRFDAEAFEARVGALVGSLDVRPTDARRWSVPVVYGGEHGPDLEEVAATHKISVEELIRRHTAPVYRCYMIGFLPGLCYLGGLDPSIALPRRPSPRPSVPPGVVSIGGVQALIGSVAHPHGWHVLGRTPVRSFMTGRDPVFLFGPGDEVVFEPIAAADWDMLEARAAEGDVIARRLA